MSIGTYTEFQPLQEVLVGSAFDTSNFDHLEDVESRDVFKRCFQKTFSKDVFKRCVPNKISKDVF